MIDLVPPALLTLDMEQWIDRAAFDADPIWQDLARCFGAARADEVCASGRQSRAVDAYCRERGLRRYELRPRRRWVNGRWTT